MGGGYLFRVCSGQMDAPLDGNHLVVLSRGAAGFRWRGGRGGGEQWLIYSVLCASTGVYTAPSKKLEYNRRTRPPSFPTGTRPTCRLSLKHRSEMRRIPRRNGTRASSASPVGTAPNKRLLPCKTGRCSKKGDLRDPGLSLGRRRKEQRRKEGNTERDA